MSAKMPGLPMAGDAAYAEGNPPISAGGSEQRQDSSDLFEDEGDVGDTFSTQEPAREQIQIPQLRSSQPLINSAPAFLRTSAAPIAPGPVAIEPTVAGAPALWHDRDDQMPTSQALPASTAMRRMSSRNIAQKMLSTLPGISIPALCSPVMMTDVPTVDPLTALLAKHIPPHLRPSRDLSGGWPAGEIPNLPLAIQTNAWRRVAMSARSHIEAFGATMAEKKGGVAEVLAWWNIRLHALWRLRLVGHVSREMQALWSILEATEISRVPGAEGDVVRRLVQSPIIPFSLQVLHAKEPRLHGNFLLALERCMLLLRKAEAASARFDAASKRTQAGTKAACRSCSHMWHDRALRLRLLVAGLLVEMKDYPGAVDFLSPMMEESAKTAHDPSFLSAVGRLYLQCGKVEEAAEVFVRSEKAAAAEFAAPGEGALLDAPLTESIQVKTRAGQLRTMLSTNKALLHVASGDYVKAEEVLRGIFTGPWRSAGENKVDLATQLNNLAVALFYLGFLEEPLEMLETLLKEAPSSATATEALIFNLTTFYELSRDDSIMDKRRILMEVAQWAGEGHSTSALKLA